MSREMIQIPVSINRGSNVSIQDQLVTGIRLLIAEGTIKSNMRLPATRELSKQLNVSRNTVKNVYYILISEGYLYSKKTSGTYVCSSLPDQVIGVASISHGQKEGDPDCILSSALQIKPYRANEEFYNFQLNSSDPNIMPTRIWRRLILKHLPYRSRYVNRREDRGLKEICEAIVESISPLRGMYIDVDNIFIVPTSYAALDIVTHALLNAGDGVVIEAPADAGIKFLCDRFGVQTMAAPIDDEGIIVDQLPDHGVRLVYVTPSHQQPMGVVMSLERRQQLLAWAARVGAYIVECDTSGEFRYDDSHSLSLYALDDGQRVIYINTMSTWIGAGLELGYLIVPPKFVARVKEMKIFLHSSVSWLDQIVTADFITSESFFCHLRRVMHTYEQRQNVLIQSLEKYFGLQQLSGYKAGRHLVWELPEQFPTAAELQRMALKRGLGFRTLSQDYSYASTCRMVMDTERVVFLSYAALSESKIEEGIACLGGMVSSL